MVPHPRASASAEEHSAAAVVGALTAYADRDRDQFALACKPLKLSAPPALYTDEKEDSPFFQVPTSAGVVNKLPFMTIDPKGTPVPSGFGETHFVAAPRSVPTSFQLNVIARYGAKPKGVGPRGAPGSKLAVGDTVLGSELDKEDLQMSFELDPEANAVDILALDFVYEHFLKEAWKQRAALFKDGERDFPTIDALRSKFKPFVQAEDGKSTMLYATVRGWTSIVDRMTVDRVGGLNKIWVPKAVFYRAIPVGEELPHKKPSIFAALVQVGKGVPALAEEVPLRQDGAIASAAPYVYTKGHGGKNGPAVWRRVSPADIVDGTRVRARFRFAGFHKGAQGLVFKIALDYAEFKPTAPTRQNDIKVPASRAASRAAILAYMDGETQAAALLEDSSAEAQTAKIFGFSTRSAPALKDEDADEDADADPGEAAKLGFSMAQEEARRDLPDGTDAEIDEYVQAAMEAEEALARANAATLAGAGAGSSGSKRRRA